VTERQLGAGRRGAVVDPSDAVDLLTPTAMRGVIDRQQQIGAIGHAVGQDQIEHPACHTHHPPTATQKCESRAILLDAHAPNRGRQPGRCSTSTGAAVGQFGVM
jgi:hypothetical protein